jgi:glutaredoxin-related protein
MVKVYVMESCPDCVEVKARYKDDPGYELVDIGKQARSLKEFLVLRDSHPSFAKVRERGNIGIPCFVKEDGSVIISLKHYDASLNGKTAAPEPEYAAGTACNLDGTGC